MREGGVFLLRLGEGGNGFFARNGGRRRLCEGFTWIDNDTVLEGSFRVRGGSGLGRGNVLSPARCARGRGGDLLRPR